MNKLSKKWMMLIVIAISVAILLYIKFENVVPVYAVNMNDCTVNHEVEERKEIEELNEMQKQIADKYDGIYMSAQGYTYKCDECGYVGISI